MLISVFLSRFQSVCAHVHLHQPAVGVNVDVLPQVPSASATHAEVVNAHALIHATVQSEKTGGDFQ